MKAETIYQALLAAGLSPVGACGLLGNMQAESGLKANIVQRGTTRRSDEDYTAAADMGLIDFAHDSIGYGLCQWTFWSRKQALLNFAQERGTSVGDEAMQVEFCVDELKSGHGGLYAYLCTGTDLRRAAERVCREYERPAINNVDERYEYAKAWYERLTGSVAREPADGAEERETRTERYWPPRMLDYREGRANLQGADVLALQALLAAHGYDCPVSGDFDAETRASVLKFQTGSRLTDDGVAGDDTWAKLLAIR